MNKMLAVGAFVLALGPVAAFAGEGNGPDFPGLQVPDLGITTMTQGISGPSVTDHISHRADAGIEPSDSFPSRDTPDGIVRQAPAPYPAMRRHVAAMNGYFVR